MPPPSGGRYILHELLGTGGTAAVYRAFDRLTGATVALKRVKVRPAAPSDPMAGPSAAEHDALRLALANEFQTLASLRHPNIVGVLDYGFEAGPDAGSIERQPYFTMEYLPGARTLVEAGLAAPLDVQVELLVQVLHALAYIHRRGIVHRDLKPGNVLVAAAGDAAHAQPVKVLDFGLSAVQGGGAGVSGTVAYMAPEVLAGKVADPAADLYAVGVMAYELFAGRHPFNLADVGRLLLAVLHATPDLAALPVPPALAAVVGRLLARDPAARYETADACLAALCQAAGRPLPPETIAIRESFLQAARFVGREAELGRLSAALDGALAGRGSAWLVGGESGVGKTRLLDELRTRALVAGALVLRGHVSPTAGAAYQVWREPLRRLVLTTPLTDLEAAILQPLVPDIGALLDRPIPAGPPLEGEAGQQRLLATLAALFRRQSAPLLLILEDLQWATESLDVLRYLAPLAGGRPLLLVGSYRSDDAPTLPAALPAMHAVRLERLSEAEVRALGESMLGAAGRRPEIVRLLQRESEGNTFFLVEVARALAEEAGRLSEVGRTALPERVLPRGIETVVRRRLAGVPEEGRALLRLAAIAGRQVDLAVMAVLAAPRGPGLEDWLTACANAAVLELRDGQWRFAHDKLRAGLLAALPGGRAEERALHREVALAVESTLGAGGPGERAAALAYHWGQAGDERREGHYARLAGEQAAARYANADALAHLRRALELTSPADIAGRYALLLACERVYDVQGLRAERLSLLDELAALAARLGPEQQAETAVRQAAYGEAVSDYPAAIAAARRAIERALAAGHAGHEAAGFLYWGMALWRLADGDARLRLEQALARARAAGLAWLEASALRCLGGVAWGVSDYTAARGFYTQALDIDRRIGDRRSEGRSLNNLGLVAADLGEYAVAVDCYEQALRIYRDIGDLRGEGVTRGNLGLAFWGQGHYSTAQQCFEQSLHVCQAVGIRSGEGNAANNLGLIAMRVGAYAAARDWYERALRIYRDIGDRRAEGIALSNLAYVCTCLGDLAAGERHAGQAVALARLVRHRHGEASALGGLADNLEAQGRLAEAEAAYEQALSAGRAVGDDTLLVEALAGLARVRLAQGDPDRALAAVQDILPGLAAGIPHAATEPFQICLTCFRVLRAAGDPRARGLLADARAALLAKAAVIGDDALRRSFLENVPHHRELLAL